MKCQHCGEDMKPEDWLESPISGQMVATEYTCPYNCAFEEHIKSINGNKVKLKFWDKEGNHMIPEREINDRYHIRYYDGLYIVDTEREDEDGYDYELDVIILRYSNLHDKKGKEICQGDIVEIMGVNYEVIINDFTQELVVDSEIGQESLHTCNKFCEVIGNIYENQVLMEGKNNESN